VAPLADTFAMVAAPIQKPGVYAVVACAKVLIWGIPIIWTNIIMVCSHICISQGASLKQAVAVTVAALTENYVEFAIAGASKQVLIWLHGYE